MKLIEQTLLTPNKYSRPQTKINEVKGIVIHYVANPKSTALGNRNYFENLKNGNNGTYASAHYIIGLQGEILQCIPDNEIAYHAGKSFGDKWNEQAKKNNSIYLGIECCHPNSSGKFNDMTINSLIDLSVFLCKKYKLSIDHVYRHYDVTGKQCPMYYTPTHNENAWIELKNAIDVKLNQNPKEIIYKDLKLIINGKSAIVKAINDNGSNYLNLREFATAIGMSVDYDAKTDTVILNKK